MAAEFVVYEVATTEHYGPGGVELLVRPGDRVVAVADRPLGDGWRYEVERVERPDPQPVKVDKDEPAPARRSGRG